MKRGLSSYLYTIFSLATLSGIGTGIFFRLYNLSFPAKQVFDEVYFPVFAKQYLLGQNVFDVHPPLGKFIVGIGLVLFGDTPFGWRFLPLLAGIALVPLFALLAYRLIGRGVVVALAALFVAVDGMFIAYSRVGLMDGILMLATFAVLLTAWKAQQWWGGVLTGFMVGVAIAIKWPAAAILVPAVWYVWYFVLSDVNDLKAKLGSLVRWLGVTLLVAAFIYVAVVMLGEWRDGENALWQAFLTWHHQTFSYHAHLTATHPWGSSWWSWPLLMRPVLFLYDGQPDGSVQVMTTLGNPLLWWSSTVAVAWSWLYLISHMVYRGWQKTARHPLTPLLIGYLVSWLPWAYIGRVLFLYHYFPAYGFALLILAYWLHEVWRYSRLAVVIYVVAVLAVGAYYMPFAVGWIALRPSEIEERLLLQSWLH